MISRASNKGPFIAKCGRCRASSQPHNPLRATRDYEARTFQYLQIHLNILTSIELELRATSCKVTRTVLFKYGESRLLFTSCAPREGASGTKVRREHKFSFRNRKPRPSTASHPSHPLSSRINPFQTNRYQRRHFLKSSSSTSFSKLYTYQALKQRNTNKHGF
jgi:hypothetical protein